MYIEHIHSQTNFEPKIEFLFKHVKVQYYVVNCTQAKMETQFSHLFCEAKLATGNQDLSERMKNKPSEVLQIN